MAILTSKFFTQNNQGVIFYDAKGLKMMFGPLESP